MVSEIYIKQLFRLHDGGNASLNSNASLYGLLNSYDYNIFFRFIIRTLMRYRVQYASM